MNREIKFRGKRVDNGQWVHGCLITYWKPDSDKYVGIMGWKGDHFEVNPETVGQYTGLKDKDGKEIYEGDKFEGDEGVDFFVVEWIDEEAIFGVSLYGQAISFGEGSQEVYDSEISIIDRNVICVNDMREDCVIGTIHDNPEPPTNN